MLAYQLARVFPVCVPAPPVSLNRRSARNPVRVFDPVAGTHTRQTQEPQNQPHPLTHRLTRQTTPEPRDARVATHHTTHPVKRGLVVTDGETGKIPVKRHRGEPGHTHTGTGLRVTTNLPVGCVRVLGPNTKCNLSCDSRICNRRSGASPRLCVWAWSDVPRLALRSRDGRLDAPHRQGLAQTLRRQAAALPL